MGRGQRERERERANEEHVLYIDERTCRWESGDNFSSLVLATP